MKKLINNKLITSEPIPYLIAEISANHGGSISNAKKLIRMAKIYGANAVKLQTYTPQTITINSNRDEFKIKNGLWRNYTLWNFYCISCWNIPYN